MNRQVLYAYQPYRIDWGQVMAFAYDYVDAKREWAYYRARNIYADGRSHEYRNLERAEFALWGVANAIGIPMYILVHAARIERKYYKREKWVKLFNYERLIVALDANKWEYDDE